MQKDDAYYMGLALTEAQKGYGRTSPNPMVGAIIVKNDEILGQGYHRKAGTPHAEVNAIASAAGSTRGATIYVTLEPCNHQGRTPPCTEAILASGITRVVIGMLDPNPSVDGGGADYLTRKGVLVQHGILEQQCRSLNYPFIKHSASGVPWVIMKSGLSLDGKITFQAGKGGAITGSASKQLVHVLRDTVDAILVGVDTVLIDNPRLTTRLDRSDAQDPLRVVLDTHLRTPTAAHMLTQQSKAETWIFCSQDVSSNKVRALEKAGAKIKPLPVKNGTRLNISAVLQYLGKAGITSLLVEGGANVLGAFLQANLIDQVYLLYAPYFIGDAGTPLICGYSAADAARAVFLDDITVDHAGKDMVLKGLVRKG